MHSLQPLLGKMFCLFLLLGLVVACGQKASRENQFGWEGVDPEKVPTELSLSPSDSILQAHLKITPTSIEIVDMLWTVGVPNEDIIPDREISVALLDSIGKELHTISVANPLEVRTAGSTNPAKDTLAEAMLLVSLPYLTDARQIAISVRGGPNEGFKVVQPISGRRQPKR
ncbi:MAG: hypothetical protein RMK52_05415 [Chitinophagales bacterium]|nr:hypothetical protein [Chitinophagales bacterium]MDW8393667.1 hypothetical protein [Chitinophagales bacterium]